MSKLRCQISISLDGFVAGPNQSEEDPLGEGGEGLHDWVIQLAAWRQSHGMEGGEVNESTRILEEALENVGAGVMGRTCSALPAVVRGGTASGRDGGATTRRTTTPCSSLPTTRVTPWRWTEGQRSTSSPTESSPRSNRQRRPLPAKTSFSGAAATLFSSTWRQDCEARAPGRSRVARRRCSHLRRPRRGGGAARAGPCRRGPRCHAPQVPGRDLTASHQARTEMVDWSCSTSHS